MNEHQKNASIKKTVKKWKLNKDQEHGMRANEKASTERVAQFGEYWQPITIKQFADKNKLRVIFSNWVSSDSGKKWELVDGSGRYRFVLDSTKVYYRVMDCENHYLDKDLKPGAGDQFMKNSHFKNKSEK